MPEGKSWLRPFLRSSRKLIHRLSSVDLNMSLDRSSRRGSGAGFVVLEIAHGGDGFDKQDAKRINAETFIFNPSEIHGGGDTGSGLGLSLAKTIVEAHGGRLWVKSAGVGRGSVFAMGIPLGSGACEVIDFFPQVETRKEQLMASWSARSNRTNLPPLPTFKDNVHQVPNSTIVPVIVSTGTVEISSVRNPRLDDINLSPSPQVMSSPLMSIPTSPREETTTASGLIGVCSVGELSALTAGKGTDSSLSGLHALVVEDSKVARTMLVKLLKSLKCTTDEAEDGAVAVKMVSAMINHENDEINDNEYNESFYVYKPTMYDFILCDSVMPVMDGPSAVQKIRAMGYDKPIIGVTGNTLPEQIQDFIAHGADEIVTKPVKLAVLKETICRRCNVVNFDGSYYPHGDAGPTKDGGLTPPRVRGMRPSKGGGSSPDSARSSLDNSRTKGLGASPHKGNVETI